MGAFGAIRFYFRLHPWQRRIMTGLVAVVLAGIAALPLYPMLRDRVVIHNRGDAADAPAHAGVAFAARLGDARLGGIDLVKLAVFRRRQRRNDKKRKCPGGIT